MNQPLQNPPVDRQYMRLLVGWRGKPQHAATGPSRKGMKAPTDGHGDNYIVELTPYHVRRTTSRRGLW